MRADGSNGEMEMAYAFLQVGFETEDINVYDATRITLTLINLEA